MSTDFDLDAFRVNEKLVVVHMEAADMQDAISQLGAVLIKQGYIKPSYIPAALERESTCPTGLPTPGIGTAIPHAGVEHTLKPGIGIATLQHPVKFGALGDPTNFIDVSVMFMMCVTKPEAQVYLLQAVINVYKDEALLRRVQAATDPGLIVREVNAALAGVKST